MLLIPAPPRTRKTRKPWALEIRSPEGDGFRAFPEWTTLRRFGRERDARAALGAAVDGGCFRYRLQGPK